MKLYKYTFGEWESYGAAKDDADAEKRKTDIDPQFHYVPVTIEEVILEGYEIIVEPIDDIIPGTIVAYRNDQKRFITMGREQLKAELTAHGVKYLNGASEQKLRELAIQNI